MQLRPRWAKSEAEAELGRPARDASRFRTLPVSLLLIRQPGGGQGPELREESPCRGPPFAPRAWMPLSPPARQGADPGPRAPARAHFGFVESRSLGHGAKRAPRHCSLRRRSVVPAGSVSRSASPGARSDRGPPRSPLRGLAPPRPAPGPAPGPPLPPRPDRQTRAAHFLEFLPSGGDKPESSGAVVRRPKSLARDTELEPPVGFSSSRLARLCLSPGPSSGVDALAWAHTDRKSVV